MRAALYAMVSAGGVAALSWEVLWQHHASLGIGVSALGTAITLAVTMAGMSTGSLVAGRWLARRETARPLHLYGNLELAIGLGGLLLVPGFGWIEALDGWLYPRAPAAAPLLAAAGMAVLIGVPTLAMGATVPVFARVARSHGVSLAALYGMNTLGASLGVLLVAFVLIRQLGVAQTVLAVAALNVLVFVLSRALPVPLAPGAEAPEAASAWPRLSPARAGAVVFLSGLTAFGLEVAWFRSLRAAFQSVTESFAIVLASVLLPLALGARAVPWLRRRGVSPAALAAAAGVAALLATPLVERMDLLALVEGSYARVLVQWWVLCLAVLGPAMLLLGTLLPWCLEEFAAPRACARLYALNTAGAVSGSLLTAWWLLPALGFAGSAWAMGLALLALALWLGTPRGRVAAAAAGAVALLVAVTQSAQLGRDRIQGYATLAGHRLLAYREAPDVTLSVVEEPGGARNLLIDGFTATADGAPGSEYMEWMGRLPMLLHPEPREALVICFGTGRTANAVREEEPEHLDVVDVSRAVFELADLFPANRGVLDDPRVRAIAMDGRAWLRRTRQRYQVITLEPMPPHFAGVNALYSREFYQLAAARLAPGGVVAQWLPLHLLPPFHAASVAATFQSVFPDAALWMGPGTSSAILLGRRERGAAPLGARWPGLEGSVAARPPEASRVARWRLLVPGRLARYAGLGRRITDDNQLLAYDLVRGQFYAYGREMARINLQLLRRVARGEPPELPTGAEEAGPQAPRGRGR